MVNISVVEMEGEGGVWLSSFALTCVYDLYLHLFMETGLYLHLSMETFCFGTSPKCTFTQFNFVVKETP